MTAPTSGLWHHSGSAHRLLALASAFFSLLGPAAWAAPASDVAGRSPRVVLLPAAADAVGAVAATVTAPTQGPGTRLRLDPQAPDHALAATPATPDAPPAAMPPAVLPASAPDPLGQLLPALSAPVQGRSEGDETMDTRAIDPLSPDQTLPLAGSLNADLWQRIRTGFGMPDLADDHVRGREQYYAQRPDYVRRMTDRGSRYLFHVVAELEKRGMPTELALLPYVESAFNPQAMSTAKASGMWQFIPSTGRDYALKQNIFRDDRRDVLASTRAALDYLERLHRMFGDWHLALAAYNWGEGSVQRAITRNQRDGLPTDYSSLRMPDETRLYVPKLQAIKNIVSEPERFGLSLPPLANHPYFLSVPIARDIDVDLAARLAGVSVEEFKQLNPQMNKPVILAAGTEQVLLPYDNANRFVDNLRSHKGPLATWTAWVAPRTLRPSDAARQVGMNEQLLREVNRIPPKMLVKAGSTLLVPRSPHRQADVSDELADNAALSLAPDVPPLRRVSLRAGKKGETVASVARRYRVSASQVAQWNKTSATGRFAPGNTIVVWVPQASRATQVASTRSGTAKASATRSSSKAGKAPVRVASKAGARPAPKAVRVSSAPTGKARANNVRLAQR